MGKGGVKKSPSTHSAVLSLNLWGLGLWICILTRSPGASLAFENHWTSSHFPSEREGGGAGKGGREREEERGGRGTTADVLYYILLSMFLECPSACLVKWNVEWSWFSNCISFSLMHWQDVRQGTESCESCVFRLQPSCEKSGFFRGSEIRQKLTKTNILRLVFKRPLAKSIV